MKIPYSTPANQPIIYSNGIFEEWLLNWFWDTWNAIKYENWLSAYTNLQASTNAKIWIFNVVSNNWIVKPEYTNILFFPNEDFLIWIIDKQRSGLPGNYVVLDKSFNKKYSSNYSSNTDYTKDYPKDLEIIWNKVVELFQRTTENPDQSINSKTIVKIIDIITSDIKTIEFEDKLRDIKIWQTDWKYFPIFHSSIAAWWHIYDTNLQKINIPKGYRYGTSTTYSKISNWIIRLTKPKDKDNLRFHKLWSNIEPIWPYQWISRFSEWKCLVIKNNELSVIDETWTELCKIELDNSISNINEFKDILNDKEQYISKILPINNIYRNWKIFIMWSIYDTTWKKIATVDNLDNTKKNSIALISEGDWIIYCWYHRPHTFSEIRERQLFTEEWREFYKQWNNQYSNDLCKINWYTLTITDNGKYILYKDSDLLIDIKPISMSIYEVEKNWVKEKYYSSSPINIDKELYAEDFLNKTVKIEDIDDGTIKINWKQFKKKLLKFN